MGKTVAALTGLSLLAGAASTAHAATNGSIARLDKGIDDILDAAGKKHLRLVWIGPPCVHTDWNSRARELDKMLAARLPARGVTYVPMRDPALCTGGLYERYDKARRMADFGARATVVPAPPASCALAPAPTPAPRLSLRLLLPQLGPECPVDELKVFVLRVKHDHAIGWENWPVESNG